MASLIGGFDREFEGFQVQGNLSVHPHGDITYGGNGSIEASGTLYVDCIESYSTESNICILHNIFFKDHELISASTLPSLSVTDGSFQLSGGLSINNTTDALSITSGGTITTAGGVSIGKQLFVGGETNLYDNASFYNSLVTLDSGSSLLIQNTVDASDFSGGALTVLGGMSIGQSFYVNGSTFLKDGLDNNRKRITNVSEPIDGLDAVNKDYLLAQLQSFTPGDCECCNVNPTGPGVQLTFQLSENVLVPEDIPTFTFDSNVYRSFLSYIYLNGVSDTKHTLFIVKGVYKQSGWVVNTSFIGDPSGIDFYVRTSETQAIIQYTNVNTIGPSYIYFNTPYFVRLDTTENVEKTLILNPSTIEPEQTSILYIGDSTIAVQGLAYVSVENHSAFFIVNCILTEGEWKYHTSFIGDETNIRFYFDTVGNIGKLTYVNYNNSPANVIWKDTRLTTNTPQFELQLNTLTPIALSQLQLGNLNEKTKHLIVTIEVPNENKAAFYFIDCILDGDQWKINSKFIGTPIGVELYCETINNIGTIYYTNTNTTQTLIRYISTTPQAFTPLDVSSGGTGVTSLLQNAVLRGNGTEGILGTSDFVYEDYVVKLSSNSSIEIYNETEPINSTSGMTITTLGGASIGKDLYVNHVNITPNSGDLVKELEYSADNNVQIPSNIDGFRFDSSKVRAFHALVSVEVICGDKELYSCHDIHGINKETGWVINNRFIGDNTGIIFNIDYDNQYGQLKYTSSNHSNWQESKIKFRALTTSK